MYFSSNWQEYTFAILQNSNKKTSLVMANLNKVSNVNFKGEKENQSLTWCYEKNNPFRMKL